MEAVLDVSDVVVDGDYEYDGCVSRYATADTEYEYDPFGRLIESDGDYKTTNKFRFSTKYCEDDWGLSYYGYRYYHPDTGRWLSRDPIGERGGLNVYGFVGNSPLSSFDPLGREYWVEKSISAQTLDALREIAHECGAELKIEATETTDKYGAYSPPGRKSDEMIEFDKINFSKEPTDAEAQCCKDLKKLLTGSHVQRDFYYPNTPKGPSGDRVTTMTESGTAGVSWLDPSRIGEYAVNSEEEGLHVEEAGGKDTQLASVSLFCRRGRAGLSVYNNGSYIAS